MIMHDGFDVPSPHPRLPYGHYQDGAAGGVQQMTPRSGTVVSKAVMARHTSDDDVGRCAGAP
jgi:hypothetical protein